MPALSLVLNDTHRTLLYHVHQNSDWVATIDRNLGIEFFDVPSIEDNLSYLLEYKPGTEYGESPLYLTTKPSSEIMGIVYPHMLRIGIINKKEHSLVRAFLESIRSISGSVLMNLTSGNTKAFEVLGVGLTKLLLSKTGLLSDSFIIPIDVHKELFDKMSINNEDSSARRADLLVVNCDTVNKEIHFHVIEIKCRTNTGNETQVKDLKAVMAEQMDNTIKCLQYHFDGSYKIPDRLDRIFKIKEFRNLLEFYVYRSNRYGYIENSKFEQLIKFLRELDYGGYYLTFEKAGIIFDLTLEDEQIKPERDSSEQVFFHVGLGVIKDLIDTLRDNSELEDAKSAGNKIYNSFIEPFTNYTAKKKTFMGFKPIIEKDIQNVEYKNNPKEQDDLKASKEKMDITEQKDLIEQKSKSIEEDTKSSTEYISNKGLSSKVEIISPEYDDFLGDTSGTAQYGILGVSNTRRVAFDLNGCNTISIFGVPGGGKSYTVGTVVEMATKYIPNISKLEKPLASVIFHYHESQDYPPEFVSMINPNSKESEIKKLKEVYGASPDSIDDVILLAPVDKVSQRQREYPSVKVLPISFASSELDIKAWKFLMGALDNQSMYIQQMNMMMRRLRENLTLSSLRSEIDSSRLSDAQREYAFNRLDIAEQFIDDSVSLRSILKPGRLIIVDLRDEFIEKEQALGLFVVMLNIFAGAELYNDEKFNKLIVFDEAHKYMTSSDLTKHVVETIRQMRHQGVTLLIASQDPPSLPNEIIELSSAVILHRFNSPQWLKHVQKSLIALQELTPAQMAALQPGEAYLWVNKASNPQWTQKAIKINTRPRVTLHGGGTQKAVE